MNEEVAQDLTVTFGEFAGDPAAGMSALLGHLVKPVVAKLGVQGKCSNKHVADFLKAADRFAQELSETSNTMAVRVKLRMWSGEDPPPVHQTDTLTALRRTKVQYR